MVEKWLYRGGVKSNCTCEQNITKKFVELHPISELKRKRLEIVKIDPTPTPPLGYNYLFVEQKHQS